MPWLPFAHKDYAIKETRDWLKQRPREWKDGTSFDFAIIDVSEGNYLGGCGLNAIDEKNRRANLGYWVRTGCSRRGIAPAATLLLAKWGFENLKLLRIEIMVATDNARSLRVAEKVGAHREGVLRNRFSDDGKTHDAVLFSFIPGDF
jgi:ribosomal-protein-serine acetyltransferase